MVIKTTQDLIINKEKTRTADLHCHISIANKRWLLKTSKWLNQPIGKVVDALISECAERGLGK